MARQKIDTAQANFGFPVENLHPSHDEMVLWIKQNARNITLRVLKWNEIWEPSIIERIQKDYFDNSSKRYQASQKNKEVQAARSLSAFQALIDSAPEEEDETNKSELEPLDNLHEIGEPPACEIEVKTEIEKPIVKYHGTKPTIVGYIDIVISARIKNLSIIEKNGVPTWNTQWHEPIVFSLDAKTEIRSLGELLRQFKSYKIHLPRMPFFIVSSDTRFAHAIIDEGFGFIDYQKNEIMIPKEKSDW